MTTPRLWSVELASVMKAGQAYAGSLEIIYEGPVDAYSIEIWATNGECGADGGAQKLFTQTIAAGENTVCFDATPNAGYTHWILLTRDRDDMFNSEQSTTQLRGATFCSAGSCSN